jgi:flagellar biosynthesis/type III secretory pathway M-ring protein FliF/YscJ
MAQINDLVKEAMGYNKDRGDSLNVQNSPFASGDKQEVETPFWKNPTLIGWVLEGLKYLVFAGLAGYLFFGVVKPFLRKLMERAATLPGDAPAEGAFAYEAALAARPATTRRCRRRATWPAGTEGRRDGDQGLGRRQPAGRQGAIRHRSWEATTASPRAPCCCSPSARTRRRKCSSISARAKCRSWAPPWRG